MICIFNYEEFIYGMFENCVGLCNSHYCSSYFDVRCVSRKFTTNLCLHLVSRKWLLMRFILSVMLERMVRFLTTVYVVLHEYSNCLPNNKWLGVKQVSIVFGLTYVKGALLMIISTSNNTVCSSSEWLQRKEMIGKKRGAPPESASA